MSFKKLFIYSLLVKLLVAAFLPLSFDEAYYWIWSHNLQLSYFDHPPLISWVIWLGHSFENLGSAVRWPGVLLAHTSLYLWLQILKPWTPQDQIRNLWIAILINPFLGFGSLILTPDLPVLFFWTASIWATIQALETKKYPWFILLGITLGLGFCSKYHIVLFVPSLLLYLFFSKTYRQVAWKFVPLTILFGLIFSLPVLMWNFQNDFTSFKYQLNHGLNGKAWEPIWTWGYLLSQAFLISPFILYGAIKARPPKQLQFLVWLGFFPLIFFLITSFRSNVEANWPVMSYASIFALVCFSAASTKIFKRTNQLWFAVYLIIGVILVVPQIREKFEKLNEPFVFSNMDSELKGYTPLFASTYQMASSLWFSTKTPVFKLRGTSRVDFFDTLEGSIPSTNKFYLLKYYNTDLPEWLTAKQPKIVEIKKIEPDLILVEVTQQ